MSYLKKSKVRAKLTAKISFLIPDEFTFNLDYNHVLME